MRSESETWEWVQQRAIELRQDRTKAEWALIIAITESDDPLFDWDQWTFQHPIKLEGPRGKVKFEIFDFYHPELKVVVEVDGSSHRNKKGSDARRDRMCAYNGIRVLRITNKEALKGAALEKIKAFLLNGKG